MPRAIAGVALAALLSVASAQELRSWQTLNFADSPDVVQEKMLALQESGAIAPHTTYVQQSYAATSRFPETSFYPLSIAGVDLTLKFAFYDGKLYRLNFATYGVSAQDWDSVLLIDHATLREVLVTGLGRPDRSYPIDLLHMRSGFVYWTDVWESEGVAHFLGLSRGGYNYRLVLNIEWPWMVDLIASQDENQRRNEVEDAADGF